MEMNDLNWFDIFVIGIILISSILAFVSGFIRVFFSSLTLFGSFAIVSLFYKDILEYLSANIVNKKIALALSSVGFLMITFIILTIISTNIIAHLKNYRHGLFDKIGGFSFGFIRGFLIVLIMFISLKIMLVSFQLYDDDAPNWAKDFRSSAIYQLFDTTAEKITFLMPEDMRKYFTPDGLKNLKSNGATIADLKSIFTPYNKKIIEKMLAALPDSEQKIYTDNYHNIDLLKEKADQAKFLSQVFTTYRKQVELDKISKDKFLVVLEFTHVQKLISSLEGANNVNDDGGSKQLDRLIKAVKE